MLRLDSPEHANQSMPPWIWAIIIALALIPAFVHIWIAAFPPEGTVHTGLHGGDSAAFIHAMRMFHTRFYTPYANCHAEFGNHSPRYFAAPFFWMYGLIGAAGHALRLPEFITLGIANSLGALAYLLAAHFFLRRLFPAIANRAFLLFALGGGPGGLLFTLCLLAGWHHAPEFEVYFERFAHYQLFEGAGLMPSLLFTRLYYTLPLAAIFTALALTLEAFPKPNQKRLGLAAILLFAATLINLRFGPMAWAAFLIYLLADARLTHPARIRWAALGFVPVLLAWLGGALMLRNNPAYVAGALATVRTSIWVSPLIAATLFFLPLAIPQTARAIAALNPLPRTLACGAAGYLGLFLILFTAYHLYYGNFLRCMDYSAAAFVSDWALLGVLPGMAYGYLRRNKPSGDARQAWAALWLTAFVAIGISAFGQGWFLRLVPQRLIVFIPMPLAIITALGLDRIRSARPRLTLAFTSAILICGISSIAIAWTCFQGPLIHRPGKGPFAWTHCELMTSCDADLIEAAQGGVVLTPITWGPAMGDVAALNPGAATLFGYGTLNFTDARHTESFDILHQFFSLDIDQATRKKLVDDWCVDYIFCPDCYPVSPEVIAQLAQAPWLTETRRSGGGVLFSVIKLEEP